MKKVVVSHHEVITAPQPWRGANLEHVMALLMMQKGLSLKPSFVPSVPSDLLPPWKITEDAVTKDLFIWQGEVVK